ncbi:unnamed protein product [Hapterophycus canaliculatus]
MNKRRLVDGGAKNLRFSPEALASKDYTPYETYTQMMLATYVRIADPSRRQLRILCHLLQQRDKNGEGINPDDVPGPGQVDHFKRDMRQRLPLYPIFCEDVAVKGGGWATADAQEGGDGAGVTGQVFSIPANVMVQRQFNNSGFVEQLLHNPAGKVLSDGEREENRVPHGHVMAIPTMRSDGTRSGAMYGDIAAQSSIFGLDSIMVGNGDKETRVVVGDAVLAREEGGEWSPCRLQSIVWYEDCDEQENSRLVATVQDFVGHQHVENARALSSALDEEALPVVWEVTNDRRTVELSSLTGRCEVIPLGDVGGHDSMGAWPTYQGAGFVKKLRSGRFKPIPSPDREVEFLPWRQTGLERMFFDRRKKGANWNDDVSRRVLSTSALLFTDAFDFRKQGGKSYSINATLFNAFAATSPHLRRQPESWPLVSMGSPGVKWQDDMDFLAEVVEVLQNGCRATLATVEGELEELSDGKFDVERFRRTDDDTEYSLEVVGNASTKTEEQNLSMEHGVNVGEAPNPLRERVSMNLIRAIGIDVFHQDAQNSSRKIIKFFLRGLSPKNGEPVIACILKDPYLRLPGAPPFRDIIKAGGL